MTCRRTSTRSGASVGAWLLAGFACVAGVAGVSGCEDSSSSKGKDMPGEQVIAAWKQAGLEVSEFAPMAGAGIASGTCVAGQVNKLDTVVCRYSDETAAKAARSAGLTYVGETTGVSLSKGNYLVVIADRSKADPSGKAIDKAAKAFLGGDKPAGEARPDDSKAAPAAEGEKPAPAAK